MCSFARSFLGRSLALFLVLLVSLLGCGVLSQPMGPSSGLPHYQAANLVEVPGGFVNTAGGNLIVRRADISIDTLLGPLEIGAIYNAESGEWLWNFQITYDGDTFVDSSGALYPDLAAVPAGATIPGTFWVKVDQDTIQTKGGLAHHFDAQGRLAYVAWATMDYPRIEYTPTTISQCAAAPACAAVYNLALNANGDPISITDARTGRAADFQYDGLDRLSVARSPLEVESGWPGTRYEYSTAGTLLTAITSSEGERIEYAYQADRRIRDVMQIGEGNPTHRFDFYAPLAGEAGLRLYPTVHTNPLGGTTRYLVDLYGRLWSVELEATGETTSRTWDDFDVSSLTTPIGGTTWYTHNGEGDIATIARPSGNVVTFTYDADALDLDRPLLRPTTRIEDGLGVLGQETYDANGRSTAFISGEGDVLGRSYTDTFLASVTSPFGAETTFSIYGIHGHWIEADSPAAPFPIKRSFDPVGNLLVPGASFQEGGVLWRSYDPNRNLASMQVAGSEAGSVTSTDLVSLGYRSDGQIESIQRPNGADHEMVYDAIGRIAILRESVDGIWRETTYSYDPGGNLTARERPNGMRDELGWDAYGRLTRRAAYRDGVLEGEALFTYQSGLVSARFDSIRNTTEVYAYDSSGRLQAVAYAYGESVTIGYDLRDRVTSQTFHLPGGPSRTVSYEYDLNGHQTAVSLDGEALVEMSYLDAQQVSVAYGNGLVRDAAYDPDSGSVVAFTTTHPVEGIVEATTITRQGEQNPPRYVVATATDTPLASTEEHYSLGLGGSLVNLDKLVGNRVWGWDAEDGSFQRYVYDELSNQLGNGSGDSFTYNAERNRLLSATLADPGATVTYSYDEAGFATSRSGVPLEWTATGRLATYGPVAIEWDMADRPVSISVGGLERRFDLFGGAIESDLQAGTLGMLDLGVVSVSLVDGERAYRHHDFRGNVSFVSDETGAIVAHYRYAAYGLDEVFGSGEDMQRFAARLDLGDGLVMMGARICDSLTGRFLSPDPILQVLNQYTYTLGNPVFFWDPDGLSNKVAIAALRVAQKAAALVGAAAAILAFALVGPVGVLAVGVVTGAVVALFELRIAILEYEDAKAEEEAQRKELHLEVDQDTEEDASAAALGFSAFRPGSGVPGTGLGFNLFGMWDPFGATGFCARAPTAVVPIDPRWRWGLLFLVCLQLVLGALVLRRRAEGRDG